MAAVNRIAVEVIANDAGKIGCPGRFEPRHRLLQGGEFKAVFEYRLRFHSPYFSFHQLPNSYSWHRLGLAVSRKVSKKAVERNRIKRQIRESFRRFQQQCRVSPDSADTTGIDFVVVAKSAAAATSNRALRRDLDQAWPRCINAGQKRAK